MAIDRMKKVTAVCEKHASGRLFKRFHEMGVIEITHAAETHPVEASPFKSPAVSTEDGDRHLKEIGLILNLIDTFAPEKEGFIQGLVPVPLIVEPMELNKALTGLDLAALFAEARELDETWRRSEHLRGSIETELAALAPFEEIAFPVRDLRKTHYTRLLFGDIPPQRLPDLLRNPEARSLMVWEESLAGAQLREKAPYSGKSDSKNKKHHYIFAFLAEKEEDARRILAAHGFEEIPLPQISGKVRDRIRELKCDLEGVHDAFTRVKEGAARLATQRRALRILKAFWESQKRSAAAREKSMDGAWVSVVTGYVREKDLTALTAVMGREFPGVSLAAEDPAPEEDVPVSLTLHPMAQPLQMLTDLFGRPAYNTFDPSPFMMVNFYLFFGICFSDVGYGLMLLFMSLYIITKTRKYKGVNNFAKLLFFGSLSTIAFGFAFGSFFGDLYTAPYLGEGNLLEKFMNGVKIVDPMLKPINVMVFSLFIGIANQMYGISLKAFSAYKRGQWAEAVCDAFTWLIGLPGFAILASGIFYPTPAPIFYLGLLMFLAGSIGLVLTQGRDADSLVGKIGVGIISLYGIVGSYGYTAFIGDTMSYCRLLALGLTTSIVALSVNLIGGMLREVPGVGMLLFLIVLVGGHLFNYAISLLGAFVHSMRLVFVEWFGRFYETSAHWFQPLGFNSPAAELKGNCGIQTASQDAQKKACRPGRPAVEVGNGSSIGG